MPRFPALNATPKTGDESFHNQGQPTDFQVLDFWRWGVSDLLNNATRGRVAEFLVSRALGLGDCVKDAWGACDLTTRSGLKIQVKCSAYLQSWGHEELSRIVFDIKRRHAWDYVTNLMEPEAKRHAVVYVFCLLHHQDKSTLDPLDLTQWIFYLVPTRVLDSVVPDAKSLSLQRLIGLNPVVATYDTLKARIGEFEAA